MIDYLTGKGGACKIGVVGGECGFGVWSSRMAKTKANEREFAGQVIHWIKEQLKEGGLPFESATNDSGLYGVASVKFPGVLLTLDFEGLRPFCGWELKTPKTDARDKELLKGAVEKAQVIEAKYFVTWNMQTAVIWRTPEKTRAIILIFAHFP